MNVFLEYSVREPVFMLYAIQLTFKTLFHPCKGEGRKTSPGDT